MARRSGLCVKRFRSSNEPLLAWQWRRNGLWLDRRCAAGGCSSSRAVRYSTDRRHRRRRRRPTARPRTAPAARPAATAWARRRCRCWSWTTARPTRSRSRSSTATPTTKCGRRRRCRCRRRRRRRRTRRRRHRRRSVTRTRAASAFMDRITRRCAPPAAPWPAARGTVAPSFCGHYHDRRICFSILFLFVYHRSCLCLHPRSA